MELSRYGVRSNAIAPAARTRLTEQTPGLSEVVKAPEDAATFDVWAPANVSPFVAYLATEACTLSGEAFLVQGGVVQRFAPWTLSEKIDKGDRWTVAELAAEADEARAEEVALRACASRPPWVEVPTVGAQHHRRAFPPYIGTL